VPVYGEKVGVNFSSLLAGPDGECALWADILRPASATVLATYTGAYAGEPAITMNSFGKGKAVYLGPDLDAASLARVLGTLLEANGIKATFGVPRGVEMTVRKSADKQWVFLLNHTAASQRVTLAGRFKDLLTGATYSETMNLGAYDVLVLQPA
jgi:beta-galactosidase